jgi:hypothetical protein
LERRKPDFSCRMDRVFVRVLRAGISILCVLAMIALAIQVLILQPIQQEAVFQNIRTINPLIGGFGSKDITMQLSLVGLAVLVFKP